MGGWLLEHPAEKAGMIGLGSGALACYFQGGRGITIYEIDPDCVEIAERYFSYLETARRNGAEVDIVIGDGRLALRGEPNAKYDVFILDAFNSGSVPAHLLTCEAMAAYMRVLKPDGLVFLHISNRHLNLAPMVQSVASAMRLHAVVKSGPEPVVDGADVSEWVAVTSSGDRLAELESAGWTVPVRDPDDLPRPWTDDYSNLPSILRLRFL